MSRGTNDDDPQKPDAKRRKEEIEGGKFRQGPLRAENSWEGLPKGRAMPSAGSKRAGL